MASFSVSSEWDHLSKAHNVIRENGGLRRGAQFILFSNLKYFAFFFIVNHFWYIQISIKVENYFDCPGNLNKHKPFYLMYFLNFKILTLSKNSRLHS